MLFFQLFQSFVCGLGQTPLATSLPITIILALFFVILQVDFLPVNKTLSLAIHHFILQQVINWVLTQ